MLWGQQKQPDIRQTNIKAKKQNNKSIMTPIANAIAYILHIYIALPILPIMPCQVAL